MSISDVFLQNFMPRNILDSEEDADAWSLGGSSGSSSQSSEPSFAIGTECRDANDFRLFQDYFGLSNLLNNVKISDDNPLLFKTQKNLSFLNRTRRSSWGSDGSDSTAVLSPTIDTPQYNFERNFDLNNNLLNEGFKQLPPPSMRLSKAMREHIISGAYQQQIDNRHSDKYVPTPPTTPVLPPSPPRPQPTNHPISNLPNAPAIVARPPNAVQVCVFCRNNGESESVYTSHVLKDADGRTSCPILRAYTCPICKANGDNSHTIKYCPMNQNARASSGAPIPPPGVMSVQQQHMNLRNAQPRGLGNYRPPFPGNIAPPQRANQGNKMR